MEKSKKEKMSGYLEIKDVEAPEYNPNPQNDIYKPYGSKGSDIFLIFGFMLGVMCIIGGIIVSYSKIHLVLAWLSGILTMLKFGGALHNGNGYRKEIMQKGKSYPGVIIQVYDYSKGVTYGGTAINQVEYAMEIRYTDKTVVLKENEVDARKYLENPYCTVYGWKKSIIATDFKVRDEYIAKNGKAYLMKPKKVKK